MSRPTILVTGGAGYIGSHVALELLRRGCRVVIYDRNPVPQGLVDVRTDGELSGVRADLANSDALNAALERFRPDAAIHLAGYIAVAESVENPAKYYHNNITNGIVLLDMLLAHGVKRFVFSSSAAVYGMPERVPIPEDHPTAPINPYGRTKWMFEFILRDYDTAWGMKSMLLRYFNAAGADDTGAIGEAHDPETHLIPLVLQVPLGLRENISVFGTDYPTRDGTCVRDYIHVTDLAVAHVLAVEALLDDAPSDVFNLGNGQGHTVREVIETAGKVVGRQIAAVEKPRRPGDPPALVASSQKIIERLGWQPQRSDLATIIESAWRWHSGK